jgi:hypothetical protein
VIPAVQEVSKILEFQLASLRVKITKEQDCELRERGKGNLRRTV